MNRITRIVCFIVALLYSLYNYALTCGEEVVIVDSVEINDRLGYVLDSVLYHNNYYTNLHDADKALYSKECFYMTFNNGEVRHTYNISLTSAFGTDFITSNCVYFRYKDATFIAKGNIPARLTKRTGRTKSFMLKRNVNITSNFQKLAPVDDPPGVNIDFMYNSKTKSFSSIEDHSVHDIYEVSEIDPTFPGDIDGLKRFIADQAKSLDVIQAGRGIVRFIVEKDGRPSHIMMIKNNSGIQDSVYERIVANMPNWNPAKHKGKECRRYMTMPISINMDK